jgi:hypothetical protein
VRSAHAQSRRGPDQVARHVWKARGRPASWQSQARRRPATGRRPGTPLAMRRSARRLGGAGGRRGVSVAARGGRRWRPRRRVWRMGQRRMGRRRAHLSLTLQQGSMISSLQATLPTDPSFTRFRNTIGVLPAGGRSRRGRRGRREGPPKGAVPAGASTSPCCVTRSLQGRARPWPSAGSPCITFCIPWPHR